MLQTEAYRKKFVCTFRLKVSELNRKRRCTSIDQRRTGAGPRPAAAHHGDPAQPARVRPRRRRSAELGAVRGRPAMRLRPRQKTFVERSVAALASLASAITPARGSCTSTSGPPAPGAIPSRCGPCPSPRNCRPRVRSCQKAARCAVAGPRVLPRSVRPG